SASTFFRSTGLRGSPSGLWFCSPWFPRSTTSLPSGRGLTTNQKSGVAGPSSSPGGENAMSRLFETPSENPTVREMAGDPTTLAPEFSRDQRRTLLLIAHGAILSVLERRPFPEAP